MTRRENFFNVVKKQGYEKPEIYFDLCPDLVGKIEKFCNGVDYRDYFGITMREVEGLTIPFDENSFKKYFKNVETISYFDQWGIGYEKGSEDAYHMVHTVSPLAGEVDEDIIKNFPFPDFSAADASHIKKQVDALKAKDLIAVGRMGQTIWERSWMIRGMEDLMSDMLTDEKIASFVLDSVTEGSIIRAKAFAEAGVDVLWVGDDVGMQNSLMMSKDMYQTWLKPRIKKVIDAAKAIKPDIIIMYHSCGYIKPLIDDFIEVGVELLNPIQPETMDFGEICDAFSDKLSFHGTIGTQSTMPLGSSQDVKAEVKKNLQKAGGKGGLICCPTHLLEPDVPIENILAYVDACKEYSI